MIVRYRTTLTASGGSASGNTDDIRGLLQNIFVKPNTSTTTYDLKITDDQGDDIYEQKGLSGTHREQIIIPIKGIHTITISNSSVAAEVFVVKLSLEEVPT